MKISMTLFYHVYQYMTIFFIFSPTSSHLHPLQVENCDSNSRFVVDEDDNGKLRLERVESPRSSVTSIITGYYADSEHNYHVPAKLNN